MSQAGDEVQVVPPKGDGSDVKTTLSIELQRTPVWSNSPPSLSKSSSKEKLTSSRKKLKESKSHEVASSSSLNKETDASSEEEARTRKRKREIRDLITMLHITMIICLTPTPSLWYLLVTPSPLF
jgi:hypothetical protein